MDEQWAAVVGVATGGVLAGVPALITAWWSRQSQREQTQSQQVLLAGQLQSAHLLQVMEPRRQVYGDFIAFVRRLRTKLYEAVDGPGDGYGRLLHVLDDEELSERLEQAHAQVALEGPETVVAAAESIMELLGALYSRVFSIEESGILGEAAAAGEDGAPLPWELAELKQLLDHMTATAREALAQHGAVALLPPASN
ncbi:hypothetical protein [Streptomyces sp. A5-4]|uniref:hypothetical protein n=1 Tax=Streptomyces sp. A5-4 TaxID=3384771 RepID=UPI003DAA330E